VGEWAGQSIRLRQKSWKARMRRQQVELRRKVAETTDDEAARIKEQERILKEAGARAIAREEAAKSAEMSVAEKEAATRAARFRPGVAVTALRKDIEVREVNSKPVRSAVSDESVAKALKTAGQTQRNLSEGKSLGKQKSEGNKLTKAKWSRWRCPPGPQPAGRGRRADQRTAAARAQQQRAGRRAVTGSRGTAAGSSKLDDERLR
jgi:hypothetical protein